MQRTCVNILTRSVLVVQMNHVSRPSDRANVYGQQTRSPTRDRPPLQRSYELQVNDYQGEVAYVIIRLIRGLRPYVITQSFK